MGNGLKSSVLRQNAATCCQNNCCLDVDYILRSSNLDLVAVRRKLLLHFEWPSAAKCMYVGSIPERGLAAYMVRSLLRAQATTPVYLRPFFFFRASSTNSKHPQRSRPLVYQLRAQRSMNKQPRSASIKSWRNCSPLGQVDHLMRSDAHIQPRTS